MPTLHSSFAGLSINEAASRLKTHGPNELPTEKPRSILSLFIATLKEPMLVLLLVCGGIYLAIGDLQEGIILFCSALIVVSITLYQEQKSERALQALKSLTSPRALVVRDGQEIRIASRELVVDDVIVLHEGDRVPADAILLSSRHLKIDESLLTGESFAVTKSLKGSKSDTSLYSATLVVAGQGIARVTATGTNTEVGKIGRTLHESDDLGHTRLQSEVKRYMKIMAFVGVGFSLLITLTYGFTRGNWPQGFLAGIAAAMSLLPEEFAVVLTVFLSMGAWRISKKNVLTRRISSVENLGSITVLCVDKTGTLTLNKMLVEELGISGKIYSFKNGVSIPDEYSELVEFAALASHVNPFDPMEKAIREINKREHADWKLIQEYPLSHELLAMSCVWESTVHNNFIIASKGAPEAILDLCHTDSSTNKSILSEVQAMSDRGLRVLAVAKAEFSKETLPPHQHAFEFKYIGLIGLADPVRSGVDESIRECYSAGVRVIMMTGDYAGTARNIASKIGLINPNNIITGSDLANMDDVELQRKIATVNIFARMVPEQKLRIIKALKASGEIVAMTGDGVNDAPSLKAADVGIAMGARGTDVAREASDLVLLDDNFSSIVAAIRLGRRIFDNIQKAVSYIFVVHAPIAGLAIAPVLLNLPLILLPAHIVFLELIIDPACAIVFEADQANFNVMNRPPRHLSEQLFTPRMLKNSVIQGMIVFVFVFATYYLTLDKGESVARSQAFLSLTLSNLGLILVSRSQTQSLIATMKSKNNAFVWIVAGTITLLAFTLSISVLRNALGFGVIGIREVGISIMCTILSVFIPYQLIRFKPSKTRLGTAPL